MSLIADLTALNTQGGGTEGKVKDIPQTGP